MKRFKNILFVVDCHLKNCDAFDFAVSLAENNQANLTVLSILDEFPGSPGGEIQGISFQSLQHSMKQERLEQINQHIASYRNSVPIEIKVLSGTPFLAIISEVLRHNRDLVIKTREDEGIMSQIFGSTDMRLLRKCPCPVWLIKSSAPVNDRRVLAAIDFDPFKNDPVNDSLNQQILELSTSLALSEFYEMHVVHAWRAYGEGILRSGFALKQAVEIEDYVDEIHHKHQILLDNLVTEAILKNGKEVLNYLKPIVHLSKGLAIDVIPKLVRDYHIDLLMMGTVGRIGIPGFFMGNTSETILNRINCSVMAIKPVGFVSPVTID